MMQRKMIPISTSAIQKSLPTSDHRSSNFRPSARFTLLATLAATTLFLSLMKIVAGNRQTPDPFFTVYVQANETDYLFETIIRFIADCIADEISRKGGFDTSIYKNHSVDLQLVISEGTDKFYRETAKPIQPMVEEYLLSLYRNCSNTYSKNQGVLAGALIGGVFGAFFLVGSIVGVVACITWCPRRQNRHNNVNTGQDMVLPPAKEFHEEINNNVAPPVVDRDLEKQASGELDPVEPRPATPRP